MTTMIATTSIRSLTDVVTKGTTPTSIGRDFTSRGVRFIKVETIGVDGGYVVGKEAFIDTATHQILKRSQLCDGDILLSIAGALGRTTVVEQGWLPANTNQAFAIIRPSKRAGVSSRYLLWALRSDAIHSLIAEINVQAAQANLSLAQVRDFEIPVPSIEDQERITAALDDADAEVRQLERLITKKESIKQGIKQQLLTGRTRLPGFTEPWIDACLGDYVSYLKTVALSRAQLDGSSPLRYLHYGDIHTSSSVTLDAAQAMMPRASLNLARNAGRLQVGDLVFADASEDLDGVGKSVEVISVPADGIVPGLHTIAARFDKSVLVDGFKAYLQFIPEFRRALLRLAAGTKVLATTRSFISSIELPLPGPEEQRAIAATVADADEEIRVVRLRLAKAKGVRRGMMQELLAGRVQLPAPDATS